MSSLLIVCYRNLFSLQDKLSLNSFIFSYIWSLFGQINRVIWRSFIRPLNKSRDFMSRLECSGCTAFSNEFNRKKTLRNKLKFFVLHSSQYEISRYIFTSGADWATTLLVYSCF